MVLKCHHIAQAIFFSYATVSLALICWFVNVGNFPWKWYAPSWDPNLLYVQAAVGIIILDAFFMIWSIITILLKSKMKKNHWIVWVVLFYFMCIPKIVLGAIFLSGSQSNGYYGTLDDAIDYNNANNITLTNEQEAFESAWKNEIASIILFFFIGNVVVCSNVDNMKDPESENQLQNSGLNNELNLPGQHEAQV